MSKRNEDWVGITSSGVPVEIEDAGELAESRPTLPAPESNPLPYSCDKHQWRGSTGPCPDCRREREATGRLMCQGATPVPAPGEPANAKEIAEAMQAYLSSNVAMLLFSKLTLYRATGENPRVVVKYQGAKFRVSLVRSNGQIENYNRDGES